ncbi:MAG TPA: hypothetical protein VLL74_08875 [Methanoregula sp.]|nr:hypothetical protein [Methanoregula sp.]
MPHGGSTCTAALPWLITLPASLAALAGVVFIIAPECARGGAGSGGLLSCGTNLPVVYLCSFLFLAAAVYSGYRLVRIVVMARS